MRYKQAWALFESKVTISPPFPATISDCAAEVLQLDTTSVAKARVSHNNEPADILTLT